MVMSPGKTFMTILTLLGMVVFLNWSTVVQAGTGGESRLVGLPVYGTTRGGLFRGTLTLTDLAFDGRQLRASGSLAGIVVQGVTQTTGRIRLSGEFTGVVMGLRQLGQGNVCNLLILDFSTIRLGDYKINLVPYLLVLNTSLVVNLPGQLLCELADLLDSPPPLNVAEIQGVLHEINDELVVVVVPLARGER